MLIISEPHNKNMEAELCNTNAAKLQSFKDTDFRIEDSSATPLFIADPLQKLAAVLSRFHKMMDEFK
jgi:hypothetical protein